MWIGKYIREARPALAGDAGGRTLFLSSAGEMFSPDYLAEMVRGYADLKSTQIYTHVAVRQLQEIHRATHPAKLERAKHEDEQGV